MTTEEDFQRALDEDPANHWLRRLFAEWLSDHDDPRAEGMLALGRLKRVAYSTDKGGHWWFRGNVFGHHTNAIPPDWYDHLTPFSDHDDNVLWPACDGLADDTRQYVEDAAALAFLKLSPERRAELLRGAEVPA